MKLTLITLSFVLSLGPLCRAQASRPVPPGMRRAQAMEIQNEKDLPLPAASRPAVSPAALQREADQLASLAASVPLGVENAGKGILEKDLIQKLKEIEKLSKRLRNELNH